jgi:hypothetical protein
LHRHVVRRVERDQIDQISAAPIAGGISPKDQLRCDLAHAFELCQARQHIAIEREVGGFRCQQGGREIGKGSGRDDQHVGAQPRKAGRHAPFDALHQHGAGQQRPAADGHGRHQQQRARLPSSEVLQRQAA